MILLCAESPACGHPAQLVHDRYNMNQNIKLSEWSAISGFICALFTFCVPHLHHLRVYSGISVVLIFIFSIIALAISIHDRASLCCCCFIVPSTHIALSFQAVTCGLVALDAPNPPQLAHVNLTEAAGVAFCHCVGCYSIRA